MVNEGDELQSGYLADRRGLATAHRRGADTPSQQTPKGSARQGALARELFMRRQFCPGVGGVHLHLLVQTAPD